MPGRALRGAESLSEAGQHRAGLTQWLTSLSQTHALTGWEEHYTCAGHMTS